MPATEFIRAPWATPGAVYSVLVEPPTFEPLTLDEAKLRAGLDWPTTDPEDPRDELMRAFIRAARERVEADTGIAIAQQTRRVTISALAGTPIPIPMQTTPTQSITVVEGEELAGLSWCGSSWIFPAAYSGTWLVVAGWPTIEALKAEAPLLVQAVALLVAHLATLGRDLATLEEPYVMPLGYEEAIQPYRIVGVV